MALNPKGQRASARGDRVRVTLNVIAAVIVISASVGFQVISYFFGILLPGLLTAAPTIVAVILVCPYLFKAAPVRYWRGPIFALVVTTVVYVVSIMARHFPASGFRTLVEIELALSCSFIGFAAGLDQERRRNVAKILFFTCTVYYLGILALAGAYHNRTDMAKNLLGGELLYLSVLITGCRMELTGKVKSLRLLVPLLVIAALVSGERAIVGFALAAWFLLLLLPKTRSRFSHRAALITAAVIAFGIVFFYLNIDNFVNFSYWNDLMQRASGRQITSGRQILWPAAWALIRPSPWTGRGFDISMVQVTGMGASVTNAFLTVLLQVGWLGLLPLLMMLWSISARATAGRRYTPWRTYFTILMVIVLLHNTFEADLVQNNFRVASLLWLCIGFACSRITTDVFLPDSDDADSTALRAPRDHRVLRSLKEKRTT
jgi:O-antigen ligase